MSDYGQYARERVPKEYWASPLFLATNQRITGVWAAAFAVMTIANCCIVKNCFVIDSGDEGWVASCLV